MENRLIYETALLSVTLILAIVAIKSHRDTTSALDSVSDWLSDNLIEAIMMGIVDKDKAILWLKSLDKMEYDAGIDHLITLSMELKDTHKTIKEFINYVDLTNGIELEYPHIQVLRDKMVANRTRYIDSSNLIDMENKK